MDFVFLFQGYVLATQLGHSIVDPVPSLFTFKIEDSRLAELSGVLSAAIRLTCISLAIEPEYLFKEHC